MAKVESRSGEDDVTQFRNIRVSNVKIAAEKLMAVTVTGEKNR